MTQMPPVHAANLVANIGNTAYRVEHIIMIMAYCLPSPLKENDLENGTRDLKILISLVQQSGTKPNLVAKILATNFGVFFCNTCNVFKNMFNVGLLITW